MVNFKHSPMILLQVVFEGIVGFGYMGDIAIDDISMDVGSCPGPGDGNLQNN